jgi:hypothetical protein
LFTEPVQLNRNEVVNLVRFLLQAKMHHEVLHGKQFTGLSIPGFIEEFDGIFFR